MAVCSWLQKPAQVKCHRGAAPTTTAEKPQGWGAFLASSPSTILSCPRPQPQFPSVMWNSPSTSPRNGRRQSLVGLVLGSSVPALSSGAPGEMQVMTQRTQPLAAPAWFSFPLPRLVATTWYWAIELPFVGL